MSLPVSRPVLIALIGALVFGVFTIANRKGGDDESSAPSAPAAQTAAPQTTSAPSQSSSTATPGTAASPGTRPVRPVKPRAVKHATALPKPVKRALGQHKVIALLFWNPKGTDDRAVKAALDSLPRRGGNLRVFTDSSKHASRYVKITSAAQVSQTPTLVVVNRRGKARVAPGYLDRQSVEQYVVDAFRGR